VTHKTNKTKQTFELIKAALHLPAAKKLAAKLPISFEDDFKFRPNDIY
jgi:hypothetical protein